MGRGLHRTPRSLSLSVGDSKWNPPALIVKGLPAGLPPGPPPRLAVGRTVRVGSELEAKCCRQQEVWLLAGDTGTAYRQKQYCLVGT